ncbi:MAG: histone deacetylase [Desulfobulbus sp.]|jgi:acetoin utilization deacetylase AcuC-like enzyme|nr:histone deacetylase [Desulfobulbus sp.]
MRRTAVYRDSLFLAHHTGRDHLESPERLRALDLELDRPEVAQQLVFPEFSKAKLAAVRANHSDELVRKVAATAVHTAYYLDADTRTSSDSYVAALRAAGAVIHAIERLDRGEIDNGFCLVRPPGHHAERDQAMGFCLFNNVAIGARWARDQLGYRRVMIVDWDVHHGNGTQHSFARDEGVLYCSVHQYPFYPGSGAVLEAGEGLGQGYTVNVPLISGHGDAEYARVFDALFAPVGRLYRPELLLVSCGFDCMAGDPVGSMRVTATGIAYLTRKMVELAREVCDGRLLLVLEGGYDLNNMRTGTLAALRELRGGPLAAEHPVYLSPSEEARLLAVAAPSDSIDQAIAWARNWWNLP